MKYFCHISTKVSRSSHSSFDSLNSLLLCFRGGGVRSNVQTLSNRRNVANLSMPNVQMSSIFFLISLVQPSIFMLLTRRRIRHVSPYTKCKEKVPHSIFQRISALWLTWMHPWTRHFNLTSKINHYLLLTPIIFISHQFLFHSYRRHHSS